MGELTDFHIIEAAARDFVSVLGSSNVEYLRQSLDPAQKPRGSDALAALQVAVNKPEVYTSPEPTGRNDVARGVKRSDLELEAQEILARLVQIISELAADRRKLEEAKAALIEA